MPSGTKSRRAVGQSGQRESTRTARCCSTHCGTCPWWESTSAALVTRADAMSSCMVCCAQCSSEHDMKQCAKVSTAAGRWETKAAGLKEVPDREFRDRGVGKDLTQDLPPVVLQECEIGAPSVREVA
eukprot:3567076-Rhodomonas_salina.3